ncbi:MAG: hemolysin family protein [Thermodesulfobacteriota bacterium]
MLTQLIVAVSLAIGVSALCSLFEAVLFSVPASQVEILASKGSYRAKVLKDLKANIHKPITAILTLNTIAHTMGAAMAGAAAATVFGEEKLGIFSIIFTIAILLLSEILPKTAGVTYAKGLAPLIALPLSWLVTILTPMVYLCDLITKLIPGSKETSTVSSEEVLAMTIMSRRSGQLDREQAGVINNIIKLKGKTVRQAMTPRTVTFTLPESTTIGQVHDRRDQINRHSRIPVFTEQPDQISGIVLRKDILLSAVEGRTNMALTILKKSVHFVPESASLNKVLLDFFERRQHLFCVVDEYGGFTGVISLEDVIEEIMGREIIDESDDQNRSMRDLARAKGKELLADGDNGQG